MSSPVAPADDDVEIIDSGHLVATRNPVADAPEFWAVVENRTAREAVTVELELRDEFGVLSRHERTHTVDASERKRYRFAVRPPSSFDQYVFNITARDAPERRDGN
ncbi:hypothetical protein [Halobellus sp. GM3]|uniref:hypothetical protein n=1 Tax=Halobellus sp. GM3 TaxID=3458410 RepID=UPI00403D74BF